MQRTEGAKMETSRVGVLHRGGQSGLNGKPLSKNYIGRHIKGVKSVLAAME